MYLQHWISCWVIHEVSEMCLINNHLLAFDIYKPVDMHLVDKFAWRNAQLVN